jgi:hypothetical protein
MEMQHEGLEASHLDSYQTEDKRWIVMEHVNGVDLETAGTITALARSQHRQFLYTIKV